jgi:hypothetical protein
MLNLHLHQTWTDAKKVIEAEYGKNKDKLALAELLALRQLAREILAARTMTGLQTGPKGHKKRFTR